MNGGPAPPIVERDHGSPTEGSGDAAGGGCARFRRVQGSDDLPAVHP